MLIEIIGCTLGLIAGIELINEGDAFIEKMFFQKK